MEPWIGAKNDRTADSTRRDRCRPRQESGASPIPELRGRNISCLHGSGQSEPGKSLGGPIILAPAHVAWAVPDFRKNVGKVRLRIPSRVKSSTRTSRSPSERPIPVRPTSRSRSPGGLMTFARSTPIRWFGALTLVAGCAAGARDAPDYSSIPAWSSRAIPEAQGSFKALGDGKREALRYKGWTTRDFGEFRTYAYADLRPEPPVRRVAMPSGVAGDVKKGRTLFLARAKAPCTGCHLIPGDDVWPAGSVGPDLSTIADRKLPDAYLYQQIYDARVVFPNTSMPPWGVLGVFTPEEIVHLVA